MQPAVIQGTRPVGAAAFLVAPSTPSCQIQTVTPHNNQQQKDVQPDSPSRLGRRAAAVAESIRAFVANTCPPPGQFLPSERTLARQHNVDKNTVRRAFKALESDGLVEVAPRHGYRVTTLSSRRPQANRCIIAYIPNEPDKIDAWNPTADRLLGSLRQAASRHGWSLLAIGSMNRQASDILTELRSTRASGVILETNTHKMVAAVQESGIPAVMIDDWRMDSTMDSMVQDGELGGLIAARHLLKLGCRRIAYFGPGRKDVCGYPSIHPIERYHGVRTAMELAQETPGPVVFTNACGAELELAAHSLLTRNPRPDGVIALWRDYAAAIARASQKLGLMLERDFHMVSWSMEEIAGSNYVPAFDGGPVPPYIAWSAKTMIEVAINRLAERIRQPKQPALRILVPVRLIAPSN